MSKHLLLIIVIFIIHSCSRDEQIEYIDPQDELTLQLIELYGSTDVLLLPQSDDFENIPVDSKNSLSKAKIELGKFLFHETALAQKAKNESGMNTYSCASCHHVKAGFQSGMLQGIGDGGSGFGYMGETRIMANEYESDSVDVQPIRSPTILNSAYQEVLLWNGQFGAKGPNIGTEDQWTSGTPKESNNLGFQGLETQAIAGLGVHRLEISPEIASNETYKSLFDRAFPEDPIGKRYSMRNAGLAIAAYERIVLSNEAPFQKWLRGAKEALSEDEVQGANLFFGKAQCYQCHNGPGLNEMSFHALGMNDLDFQNIIGEVDMATRKGRGGFTGNSKDDYKFKTPTLYNLKDLKHLGHGGNFPSVRKVIEYKNNGISENDKVPTNNISPLFYPLGLSEQELDHLEKFITESLYDNSLIRYVPINTPMNSCFPNADPQSKNDLGCLN